MLSIFRFQDNRSRIMAMPWPPLTHIGSSPICSGHAEGVAQRGDAVSSVGTSRQSIWG
jgi:hypothetical protein